MIELSGQPLQRRYGGDTLNTAVYLARLLRDGDSGSRVHYLTALGCDRLSRELLIDWQNEGIDTGRVAQLPGKLPGLYLVETYEHCERTFLYWRSDSAARHYFSGEIDFAAWFAPRSTQALYLSGISLALFPAARRAALIDAISQFRRSGGTLWFDNNYRPALWTAEEARPLHEQLIAMADIALLTLDDEIILYGDHSASAAAARALSLGCGEVLIKRGAQPCLIVNRHGEWEVPAHAVERVVDTCAAGDSFAAGYLASRSLGLPPLQAAANAHRVSAAVIAYPGAIIPTAAMPQLEFSLKQ